MISLPTPPTSPKAQVPTFAVVAVLALVGLGVMWVLFTAEPKPAPPASEGPQHWLMAIAPDGEHKWRIGVRTEFAGDDFRVTRLYSSPEGGLVGYIAHETVRGEPRDWMGIYNARGNPVWKRSKTIHDCLFPDEQSVAIVDSAPGEVFQLHLYDIKSPQLWWVPIELPDGVPFHLELLNNKSLAVMHGAPDAAPGAAERGLILLASAHGDVLYELTASQYAARPVRACAFRDDGSFVVEGRDGELVSYDAHGDEEWRTAVLDPAGLVAGTAGEVYCVTDAGGAAAEAPAKLVIIGREGDTTADQPAGALVPATLLALRDGGVVAALHAGGAAADSLAVARLAADGSQRWQSVQQFAGPLKLEQDSTGVLHAVGPGAPVLLDPASGAVQSRAQLEPGVVWSADGALHYTWSEQPGELQAWDAAGRQLWAFSEPPSQLSCPPHAAPDGTLYIVTSKP